jgi:hypothetical protein
MEAPTVVELLCDLSEASDEIFRESMMGGASRAGLQFLTKLGTIKPGPRPIAVTCMACDAGHSEVIEYDVGNGRATYISAQTPVSCRWPMQISSHMSSSQSG